MRTFTRQDIEEMIESIGAVIVRETNDDIEIENAFYGETIVFDFDENGNLIRIGS